MAGEYYSEFIEEAFIKPIRSMLIVDDDYPTYDEILAASINSNGHLELTSKKKWPQNQNRIKNMIDVFRSPGSALLVDIHDGKNVTLGEEVKAAAHLHQSDLLILDYELEKSKPGDGTRAIEILRQVMSNNHFNLVVIHTSEVLEVAFYSVLAGLTGNSGEEISTDQSDEVSNFIEDREDIEEGFSERLFDSIGGRQYFHFRQNQQTFLQEMYQGTEPFLAFKNLCDEAGWNNQTPRLILKYLLIRAEKKLLSGMETSASTNLEWSDNAVKWIRSDSVFVAFSHKPNEEDLLEVLLGALKNWGPPPPRLFLAKIRSVMDEYGVLAQGDALAHQFALAYWYNRLLTADKSRRSWLISESISRHSDQLLDPILRRVEKFASRLIEAELGCGNPAQICKDHFKVDLGDANTNQLAEREHNAIVCSKPPEGWHLTTGHVLILNEEYWVCLSPLCDLVPHQLSKIVVRTFGERMPFTAVKLHSVPGDNQVVGVQTNRFVFLQIDGGVRAFGFNNPEYEDSSPYWQTLFAEKRGVFTNDKFHFKVSRTMAGSTRLVSQLNEAQVVSQLRYEYALNLIQKLGVSMTRVGLDFVGADTDSASEEKSEQAPEG